MQSHTMSSVRGYPLPSSLCQQTSLAEIGDDTVLSGKSTDDERLPGKHIMPYRQFGQIPIQVSALSLGGGAFGGLFGDLKNSVDEIVEVALQNGINYIDTGYWYNQARSEQLLGQALLKVPRNTYYISTKVGRFELDFSRTYDYRADTLLEQLTLSLKRLKLTYVDICFLQLPDAEFNSLVSTIFNESLQALQMAKSTKKTKYIGLAGYSLNNIVYVLKNSPLKVDAVMTYGRANLCDNTFGEYKDRHELKGLGIVNGSPLSMGLLSTTEPPAWHPAPSRVIETAAEAAVYCKDRRISMPKLAIDYAVQFPGISTCLVSVESVEQLHQCLEVIHRTPLTNIEERVRSRILRRFFDKLNNTSWEGIDLRTYWKRMENINGSRTFRKHCRLQLAKQQCLCTMCT